MNQGLKEGLELISLELSTGAVILGAWREYLNKKGVERKGHKENEAALSEHKIKYEKDKEELRVEMEKIKDDFTEWISGFERIKTKVEQLEKDDEQKTKLLEKMQDRFNEIVHDFIKLIK